MSEDRATSTKIDGYVRLLGEGTDVFRPINLKRIGEGLYEIISKNKDEDEIWEFNPGTHVTLEDCKLVDGEIICVVTAPRTDQAF